MRRDPVRLWVALAAGLVSVGGLVALSTASSTDYGTLAFASLAVAVSNLLLVYLAWGRDILSGPIVYLILFVLFHLAVIWTLGLAGETAVTAVSPIAFLWIRSEYLSTAVYLSCIGCVTYTISCLVGKAIFRGSSPVAATQPSSENRWAAKVGLFVEIIGVILMANSFLAIGGLSSLSGAYGQFLESAQNSTTGYAIALIGLGACFSQLGNRTQRRAGLLIFAGFALIFFPIGLRGSILFPTVALIVMRARLGWRMKVPYLLAGAVAAMFLASVVRLTRIGVSGPSEPWYSSAASTLTELGFSIRPTVEVLKWEGAGYDKSYFVSFFAVPIRFIEKITGWNGGPPASDHRLFNVKINDLVGPIGGSPVAEGYDAAGVLGVVVVMAVVALLICRSSAYASTTFSMLAFPAVFIPLVVAVRNSFAPVIVQIGLGLILAWVASRAKNDVDIPAAPVTLPGRSAREGEEVRTKSDHRGVAPSFLPLANSKPGGG